MKKIRALELWWGVIAATILMVLSAAPAEAKNNDRKLYGDYAANFSLNCATCGTEFEFFMGVAPYCPSEGASNYTWNAQGLYHFDGEGGFSFVGRYLGVLSQPFPLSPAIETRVVLPPKIKCLDGLYTVNDDLTVDARFAYCTVYADALEKFPIHVIYNFNLKGRLLDRMDGPILLLTDTMDPISPNLPNVEEVFNPPPFGSGTSSYRICGMTGTAIPVKGMRMRNKIEGESYPLPAGR